MKNRLNVRRIMRDTIRMYFAPLAGAYKGVRTELQRADREVARHRAAEQKRASAP